MASTSYAAYAPTSFSAEARDDDEGDYYSEGDVSSGNKRKANGSMDDANPKKRNRAVLSCRPCKARKIKCNRSKPCESCIRRNIPDQCAWDDPSKILDNQPFATMNDIEDVRHRLEVVETLLARIPPNVLSGTPTVPTFAAQESRIPGQTSTAPAQTAPRKRAESEDGEVEAEGEEAAVGALEELALGHRLQVKKSGSSIVYNTGKTEFPIALVHVTYPMTPAGMNEGGVTTGSQLETGASAAAIAALNAPRQEGATRRSESTIFLPPSALDSTLPITDFLRDMHPSSLVRQAFKALPRRQITDVLVQYFFDECTWTCRGYFRPYWDHEYDQFWRHVQDGGLPEVVDPAWLAMMFAKMALAARAMPPSTLAGEDVNIVRALPEQFHKASQLCLTAAKWHIRPQFRVLQTLALYGPYVWYTANRNEGVVWLAGAVRIAQLLGIHRLGSDQATMPDWDDLAFPTGPSSVKRQLCARVWYNLMFFDATYTSMKDGATFFPVPGATTALPLNCNDDDLGLHVHVRDEPRYVLTDMTFDLFRWAIADVWRAAENGEQKTYEDILQSDGHIRKVLSTLPPKMNSLEVSVSNRLQIFRRSVIFSGMYAQIIRLHRPYYYRSFKKQKYAGSRTAVTEAAVAIIQHNSILALVTQQERFWYLYVHCFSAIICLIMDLLHLIDSNRAENARLVQERIEQLNSAKAICQYARVTSDLGPSVRIGTIGETLIDTAMVATRERQNDRSARTPGQKETFVTSFARIAAEVQASTSGMSNVETMLPHAFLQAQSSWSTAQNLPPMPTAAFSAEPTIPAAAPATMDILRSLGLSLDNLVTVSPPNSSGSNLQRSGEPSPAFGQTVAPDSVFDRIFEDADWLNSTIWQT